MTVFRDLAQHILDIAENGIKADATLLNIDIHEQLDTDRLTISVHDNGHGMDAKTLVRVIDPWFTTRTTRNVGLGIPFFKQTAEMCGGGFDIHSEPGRGTTTQATFQHSHIDRPPLGDLVGTLLCLIVGNPTVDFEYQHNVNDQVFSLVTREIREVLGDEVPLSDPGVLAYLRGTLEEGLAALTSERLRTTGSIIP